MPVWFWMLVALLDISGFAAICIGLWMVFRPAALIVGGILLLVIAYRLTTNYTGGT